MSNALIAALGLIAPGDLVIYHGSVAQAHGGVFFVQPCVCRHCIRGDRKGTANPRYLLTAVTDGARLYHARRQSFVLA